MNYENIIDINRPMQASRRFARDYFSVAARKPAGAISDSLGPSRLKYAANGPR
jgi:hypothetical protein